MIKIKNSLLKALSFSGLALLATPSFAAVDVFAANSACNTLVGTTETAGSGGISNGSGGLRATSDLTIISCVLPTNTPTPGVEAFILDKEVGLSFGSTNSQIPSFNGTTACSLTAYDLFGNVRFSDTDFSDQTGKRTLYVRSTRSNTNGYYGFACRLSRGDELYMYQLYPKGLEPGTF
ncbi:hypothetical protein [Pseudoalteromonas luteoviolacea]|uniref:Spore coat protein U domain-containing protein n=1 Tax=Pseudoalteromonas luteoviolacea H33 TaxID=1365251 RepID=A0A162AHI3_9GAMM|nr:hypothetical protein [Pseudoalteromonas luteoviolacea]KZN50039.1 hypothetical protein N476_16970 [Pseudoalteromonas luteoviolacea H33]KZN76387.1 hypothetical protein N477_16915 [Pseudoalteromonas luteoviolacea H33-S]MBQ4877780.1 hypothetical protein [Pseudoalteromonas luteoviolacea]MBQ4906774.1 hypothetical protein [Pseudoalteromonas luteoviolacea]